MTGEEYILNEYKFQRVSGYDSETNKKGVESKLALMFCDAMSKGYFRKGEGGIMHFDGLRYVVYDEDDLEGFLEEVIRSIGYSSAYQVYSIPVIRRKLSKSRLIPVFKPNSRYLSFTNGYYDFDTDKFIKGHSHEIDTCIYIPHEYIEGCRGNRFKNFLKNILPDKEVRNVLQEACGSMFIDRLQYKMEYAFYLLGSGSNGKSTFTDLLGYMLGKENVSHYSMAQICDENKGEYYRGSISGKVVNICTDMGSKDFGDNGTYKLLVSGEPMSCRFPGGRAFDSYQVPLIFANVNKMPYSSDQSHGYHRRNIVIPFDVTIDDKDQDKELGNDLKEEISVFIEWVLDGRIRLKSNGGKLTSSSRVDEARMNAKLESNSLLMFLHENNYYVKEMNNYDEYKECKIGATELCNIYVKYCEENRLSPKSNNKIYSELNSFGVKKKRYTEGMYYKLLSKVVKNEEVEKDVQLDVWGDNRTIEEIDLPF